MSPRVREPTNTPPPSAETVRRNTLRDYGLTEDYLTYLRGLDKAEATWQIEHEHKVMLKFVEERKQFIIEDTVNRDPEPRKRQARQPTHVTQRRGSRNYPSGDRLG